jgi:small subunit ribosomal protein S6
MSRAATAPGRAKEYETIYILRPDIDADNADKIGGRVADVMAKGNGRLTKVELWGRRRLAYDIGKQKRGVYVYLKYLGSGGVVSELERNLRLFDHVMKYQTVLVRSDVEVAAVAVDDADVKFERVELPPIDDDLADSRERQLGLVEPERREMRDYDEEREPREEVKAEEEEAEEPAAEKKAEEEPS